MIHDLITIELARMVGAGTDWARIFKDYDLLTLAGIPDDEALRIATQAAADRAGARKEIA